MQASGAAPLALGLPVDDSETVTTAIRLDYPARSEQALQATEQSGSRIIDVINQEIRSMQRCLAGQGLCVEPPNPAGLAVHAHEIGTGKFNPQS